MMTCGGCCGAGLSAKLENLAKKSEGITPSQYRRDFLEMAETK